MKIKIGKILFAVLVIFGLFNAMKAGRVLEYATDTQGYTYIKIAAQGGMCGFITLNVNCKKPFKLMGYMAVGDKLGGLTGTANIDYNTLNKEKKEKGIIIPFDYAGTNPKDYYRIYVEENGSLVKDIKKYITYKTGSSDWRNRASCIYSYTFGGLPRDPEQYITSLYFMEITPLTKTSFPSSLGLSRPGGHEFVSDPALIKAIDDGKFVNIGNPNGDIVGTIYNKSNKKIFVMMFHPNCDPLGIMFEVGMAAAQVIGSIAAIAATGGAATPGVIAGVAAKIGSLGIKAATGTQNIIKAVNDAKACDSAFINPGEYGLFKRWHPGLTWKHQDFMIFDIESETTGDLLAMQKDVERNSLSIWDGRFLWFATDKWNNLAAIQKNFPNVRTAESGNPNYQRIKNFTQGGKALKDMTIFKTAVPGITTTPSSNNTTTSSGSIGSGSTGSGGSPYPAAWEGGKPLER